MKKYVTKKPRVPAVIALAMTFAGIAQAEVKLPSLFNDSMVIQRETQAPVWGWADAGEKVSVEASWGAKAQSVADAKGKWMVKLATPKAGGPHTIQVIGSNTIELNDVLSGDVWICSGQSNMEWNVHNSINGKAEIEAANFPMIRHYDVPHLNHLNPRKDHPGTWAVCSPKNVRSFTAVGYFFAREIHRDQNVPVGILSLNWGGTRIEPWIPPAGFHAVPELEEIAKQVDVMNPQSAAGKAAYSAYLKKLKVWVKDSELALNNGEVPADHPQRPSYEGNQAHQAPTVIYNSMIHPVVPSAIKGAIWYQGEANGSEGLSYQHKMQGLVKGWRSVFQQGDFPFYFVQLANFQKSDPKRAEGGDGWARVRQAQLQSLQIKNTGMACAIDVGEAKDIHPRNKQDVGRRLARWALVNDYGKKNLVASGPLYKSMKTQGAEAVIEFDHVGSGLMVAEKSGLAPAKETQGAPLKWFSIQAEAGQWYKADAKIQGDTVVVSNPQVKNPVAVRYGYTMNPEGANLYNKDGLPASPFTTDTLK